jgi:hypothetical protein
MIQWVLRRAIDKSERDWNFDASYMRDRMRSFSRYACVQRPELKPVCTQLRGSRPPVA